MNDWKKVRSKAIIIEILAIFAIAVFIVIGLLLQLYSNTILGTISNNIDKNFALAILQIQATVDTLTISIIALISGCVSDSSMGIVFSDYYLNIRPYIFKQKRIIAGSILLLVTNIGFYSIKWYCFLLSIFVVTIILILISTNEIYLIFNGKRLAEREIKEYICYVLSKKCGYRKKYTICMEFVSDWKNIITLQSRENYENYKEVFMDGIIALLGYKTQESLTGINEICKETEYCFLNSENSIVKENGIELLEEIYGNLHKFILDNQKKINYQKPFNLFDETIRYVVDAIKEMSPENVQKCVRWDGFIECVQRITFCMGYDKDNPEVGLENTYYFARYAGNYLSMNYDKKYELYWKQILERCFWTYTANIPKEGVEGFLKAQCIVKFNYIYGFIENGLYTLVIDSFFLRGYGEGFLFG